MSEAGVTAVTSGRFDDAACEALSLSYRCYSILRTRTALGSYGRASPRSIGQP